MTTLATIRDRIEQFLGDLTNATFTTGLIDEALSHALDEYTAVSPHIVETVITCPAAGREVALDALTDLMKVLDVWWPYDSDATSETWPPNRVQGYQVYWDDARPVLLLPEAGGSQPALGDEIRLWYTAPHTIQDLNAAAVTTIPAEHDSLIARGAAGFACLIRAMQITEDITANRFAVKNYESLAQRNLYDPKYGFYPQLDRLRSARRSSAPPFASGWTFD